MNSPGAVVDIESMQFFRVGAKPVGGGIGQAPGFVDAVAAELKAFAPVIPTVKMSALGADAVLDGCLAAGLDRAWALLTAAVPGPTAGPAQLAESPVPARRP